MSIFTTRPGEDSTASLLEAVNKAAGNVKPSKPVARPQKGSFVLPNAGPHKGMRHKVTHIHEDGSMTVVPWDVHPSQIKYRMGAAKATADQLEPIDEAAPNHPIPDVVRAALPPHMVAEYDKEKAKKKPLVKEEIKGWKNAGADIAKFRRTASNAAKSVKLVKLKKDGTESKMHDATSHYTSEDEATKKHHYWRGLNPKQNMKHNLYIDGKLHKTLHEEAPQTLYELSRATLGRYVKASHHQIVSKTAEAVRSHEAAASDERRGDHEGAKWWKKNAQKAGTKAVGREYGHARAVSKLMKEDNSRNLLIRK